MRAWRFIQIQNINIGYNHFLNHKHINFFPSIFIFQKLSTKGNDDIEISSGYKRTCNIVHRQKYKIMNSKKKIQY